MKYNVQLEFWANVEDVEADSREDAIRQALIKLTNDPNDYFIAEDETANKILEEFIGNSVVEKVED